MRWLVSGSVRISLMGTWLNVSILASASTAAESCSTPPPSMELFRTSRRVSEALPRVAGASAFAAPASCIETVVLAVDAR